MVNIDEELAHIQMAVDLYDSAAARILGEKTKNDGEALPVPVIDGSHWNLSSSLKISLPVKLSDLQTF